MSTLRWGLVGAGRIAHSFAQDVVATPNAELVAVAARDRERAAHFAQSYGIPHAHEGYAALYADAAVDAVYVATPHSYHLRNSRDALNAGKAVLCEKPLVVDPAECRALIADAAESGGYLMEGMWTWFLPALRRARDWVRAGRIGQVLHVKSDFGYPLVYSEGLREYDARIGGGCLLEMGIYPVAVARYFLERAPVSVGVVGRRAPNGVEDDVAALLDYGDSTAQLGTSFRCKLQNWSYVIGSEGYIAIPDTWRARQCSLYRLDERIDHFDDGRSTLGFDYQIEEVSAEILAGKRQSDTVPLAASLAFQEDMAAIKAAI